MTDINHLIKSLERGICPDELNFGLRQQEEIDWQKVRYNTFFKSHEFFENKFPEFNNFPAFDAIIDQIVEKNKDNSPLKEMEERSEKLEVVTPISPGGKGDESP
jgi:hypothetical protein